MAISTRVKYILGLFSFVIIISAGSFFYGCKPGTKATNGLPDSTVTDDQLTTEQLVTRYCTKCHAATAPNLLTKDVWNYHTLPSMAVMVGISTYGNDYFKNDTTHGGISITNWKKIVNYFIKAAPDTLASQKRVEPLINDQAGFKVKLPASSGGITTAFTTMVNVDPITQHIYSADNVTSKLYQWDGKLNAKVITTLPSAAVSMAIVKEKNYYNGILTCIGELEPQDFPNGKVLNIDLNASGVSPKNIETDLSRPLYTSAGDFNKDGLMDYAVATNGNIKGELLWMKQNGDGTYTRNIIKKPAGPVQTLVGDFNKDGWPDIMVLYGSGNEGLSLFINNKKGSFTERVLLQFPPTYGSSSFQLTDIDHDGNPDLVYTCGYNYRDSRILKPYTGLYIYLNTGNWNFKQKYFYPINGCTKAIAADFDGDGDIDITTSAFFADLKNQPEESFIYFEQDKAMHFKPHAIPVSKYGRWFSMDAGDVNGDGKTDIVLGNYSKGLSIGPNQNLNNNGNIPLIVLENHTKQ